MTATRTRRGPMNDPRPSPACTELGTCSRTGGTPTAPRAPSAPPQGPRPRDPARLLSRQCGLTLQLGMSPPESHTVTPSATASPSAARPRGLCPAGPLTL